MKENDGYAQLQEFLQSLPKEDKEFLTLYVGIDPGATGAIAFLHPTNSRKSISVDIPTVRIAMSRKTASGNPSYRTQTDLGSLWDIFLACKPLWHKLFVVIEHQQPIPRDTPLTGFTVGNNFGMWPLFLYSHGIVHDTIRPVKWKKAQGLIKQDKEAARLRAQKLFPNASLNRKKDHNRAEALLIVETYRAARER